LGRWPKTRVRYFVGDGVEELRRQRDRSLDVVFVDMEKTRYPLGFRAALPKLRRGGLLIADNVLWSGRVVRPAEDPATLALQRFTRLITASPRLETVIHPLRDGVSVSLKLE
jgi:caffeoyl-CoA O-methyltransferase